MTAGAPRVGIVICTRNRRDTLMACLDSLARQDYPSGLTGIWIYDDAGSDGSSAAASARLASMLSAGLGGGGVIPGREPRGISAGRNEAAARALPVSDLLLFMDDDVRPDPGCLSALVGRMSENQGTGVAAPLLRRSDDGRPLHAPYFVGRFSFRYSSGDPRAESFCDWVDPACVLVSRDAFSALGGFWPGYYRSHEGVDLCLRAARAGFKVLYCPAATAVHVMRSEALTPDRLYYLYRNKFTVVRRNSGALHRALLLPLMAAAGLPKYLFDSVLRRRGLAGEELSAIFSAVLDGLAGREGPRAA
ncbi:MAG: glycosyltransferase family 2 protein [Elusimicrobia bacterium]|nr:glycosyltransferase family 2 protein [Elusimicrobiota bacterium]